MIGEVVEESGSGDREPRDTEQHSRSKDKEDRDPGSEFRRAIAGKAARKQRARRERVGVWSWFGMFGLVGWSVTVPTVLGTAFGVWLDNKTGGGVQFTLAFLFLGVIVGCWTAWRWVREES